MSVAGDPTSPRARPTSRLGTALAVTAAAVTLGVGCSVEKHYALLSFFFDGVPEPHPTEGPPGAAEGGGTGLRSAHRAFLDRRCTECHAETSRFGFRATGFAGLNGTVCLKCHEYVLQTPRQLHGPVAATACLWCHDPHELPHPYLLAKAAPALCLDCHTLRSLSPLPAHEAPARDCLQCHQGHGGADRRFLREDYRGREEVGGEGSAEPAAAPPSPTGEGASPREKP